MRGETLLSQALMKQGKEIGRRRLIQSVQFSIFAYLHQTLYNNLRDFWNQW